MSRRRRKTNAGRAGDGKSYYTRNQKRKLQQRIKIGAGVLLILLFGLAIMKMTGTGLFGPGKYREIADEKIDATKPDIDVQLLTVNEYSRPGIDSNQIKGIVIHYTANPGAGAMANRNYFENLKDTHLTKASSHFVVGLEGEVVQCIPTWEVAYASNERNMDTVSIECCHPDDTGQFNEATYRTMVQLTAWLCEKFSLTEEDVIRHYDVTGKNCPKYFVEHEEAWEDFRADVKKAME